MAAEMPTNFNVDVDDYSHPCGMEMKGWRCKKKEEETIRNRTIDADEENDS